MLRNIDAPTNISRIESLNWMVQLLPPNRWNSPINFARIPKRVSSSTTSSVASCSLSMHAFRLWTLFLLFDQPMLVTNSRG